MVLKFSEVAAYVEAQMLVSVPLRGYGFEIGRSLSGCWVRINVSVPLRGYGFEIFTMSAVKLSIVDGFRPLAGIWF